VSRTNDRDLAEDLVQETFLAALKGAHQFRGDAAQLSWLTGILRHKIADELRQSRKRTRDVSSGAANMLSEGDFDGRGKWRIQFSNWPTDPQKQMESKEFFDAVDRCVAELPANLACAFQLKQLESQSTDEVCRRLQISAGNLSVRMHRARLLLRVCLQRNWFGA